jgi:O-antigen/teichoic acid export membrane protein
MLRLGCWAVAVFFAITPVTLGIAASPQQIGKLFRSENYVSSGRELILVAIAVLAIGLIDSLETLLIVQNRRTWRSHALFGFTFLLMLLLISQLFRLHSA